MDKTRFERGVVLRIALDPPRLLGAEPESDLLRGCGRCAAVAYPVILARAFYPAGFLDVEPKRDAGAGAAVERVLAIGNAAGFISVVAKCVLGGMTDVFSEPLLDDKRFELQRTTVDARELGYRSVAAKFVGQLEVTFEIHSRRLAGVLKDRDPVSFTMPVPGDLNPTGSVFTHERQDVSADVDAGVGILVAHLCRDDNEVRKIARASFRLQNPAEQDRGRLDSHSIGKDRHIRHSGEREVWHLWLRGHAHTDPLLPDSSSRIAVNRLLRPA